MQYTKNYKILLIIFILFLSFYGLTEKGSFIMSTKLWAIILRFLLSMLLLVLSTYKANRINLLTKFHLLILILFIWFHLFVSLRLISLVYFIWIISAIICSVLNYIHRSNKQEVYQTTRLDYIICFVLIMLLSIVSRITLIQDTKPFILIALMLPPFIIIIIYFVRKIYRERRMMIKFGYVFGFSFLSILSLYMVIIILNYSLDYHKPLIIETKIIDKEISTGARKITTYELLVLIDEKEVEINVSSEDYYQYQIDEMMDVSIYSGFLGYEYYIHE